MFSKSFFTLAVLVASAAAQSTTSTSETEIPSGVSGITPCIIGCVQPAAEANGCAFTDPTCVCSSAQFQADARACLESTCSAAEVQAALGLQAQQCGASAYPFRSSRLLQPSNLPLLIIVGISATGTATTPSQSGTVSTPSSTSSGTGTSTGTSTSPGTSTTPTSTTRTITTTGTTSSGTTTGTSPPAQTSNAAVGKEGSVGMLGAVVFGLMGLAL